MTSSLAPSSTPANSLRAFLVGDVVGRPGRNVLVRHLAAFKTENHIDFCVVNGENASGGAGMTAEAAKALLDAGVDVLTSGDHVWKKKDIIPFMESDDRLLRPANLSPLAVGRGYGCYDIAGGHRIGVINLIGRAFMMSFADCPFRAATEIVTRLRRQTPILLVDLHAEATSEKIAMGWHLDGKVSAIVGTHTHVQTADERVLPNGTAYLTDLGMTGPHDSVIGRRTDRVLKYLTTQMPTHFDVGRENVKMCGAIVTIDAATGSAIDITRIQFQDSPERALEAPR